ncbi:hypothetical protein KRMM14A1004_47000 [Krasilnikovia sp. MM14-A1004]
MAGAIGSPRQRSWLASAGPGRGGSNRWPSDFRHVGAGEARQGWPVVPASVASRGSAVHPTAAVLVGLPHGVLTDRMRALITDRRARELCLVMLMHRTIIAQVGRDDPGKQGAAQ